MHSSQELISQDEIVELLESEGLTQGTKEFQQAASRFIYADMENFKRVPLYFETDSSTEMEAAGTT